MGYFSTDRACPNLNIYPNEWPKKDARLAQSPSSPNLQPVVGFLYPFFLLAGFSIAIPIAIHLFDLRRFKTVVFPATRFLKEVALQSRRQSKIRQRLLLALRCALLLALVAAFAQPYFGGTEGAPSTRVVYIDNGPATSARQGSRTLLAIAKESAARIIRQSDKPLYLVTAGGPVSYQPLSPEGALTALGDLQPLPARPKSSNALATIEGLLSEDRSARGELWWISDFPKETFSPADFSSGRTRTLNFRGVVLPTAGTANLWIDTAMVLSAPDAEKETRIAVRSRRQGPLEGAAPALRLTANGRFQSAGGNGTEMPQTRTDTLTFSGSSQQWQQLEITLADPKGPAFDDTFRIAVRPTRALPVLALHEGIPNPYLRTALAASGRLNVTEASLESPPARSEEFSLIVLSGLTDLPAATATALKAAVLRGVPLVVLPARTGNLKAFERSLKTLADLQVRSLDTASQTAADIETGSPLIQEIFENIPANAQLPAANWHYRIGAGFGAGAQTILSFRNGDPLLAQYSTGSGPLYLLTTSADAAGGTFARSYFFAPLLYAAAFSASGSAVNAYTLGAGKAHFVPRGKEGGSRSAAHLVRGKMDFIPPQRAAAGGIDLFPDGSGATPGFYSITAPGADTQVLALNASRLESGLDVWSQDYLEDNWKGGSAQWFTPENLPRSPVSGGNRSDTLWKIVAVLALLLFFAETYVLVSRKRSVTATPVSV